MLSIPSISLINTTNHQKNNIINFPSSLHISHQTTQISLQTPPATTTTTTTKPLYSSTPLHLTMPPHPNPNPNPPPQTHPSATAILTTKTISITHSPLNPPTPTPTPKNPHTARLDSINKLRSEWAQDPRKFETWYARDCERQYLENLAAMDQLFAEDKTGVPEKPASDGNPRGHGMRGGSR